MSHPPRWIKTHWIAARWIAARRPVALAAAVALSGCLGFGGDAPDLKTKNVMANFQKGPQERIVVDRNYTVGKRFRVQPGEVMIRNKLYTLAPENVGAYRAELGIALVGDGLRVEIPQGSQLRVSDRVLVAGKLANLVPLPQPPAAAPDVTAIFANDDGTLLPAVYRGGRVAAFAKFAVTPEKAQLTPEYKESVKTSAGYVNYEVIYNAYGVFSYVNCAPPKTTGDKSKPDKSPPKTECGSGPHFDLTVVQYDRMQLDRASTANRAWYPVRSNELLLPGLKLTVYEMTPTGIVVEVTKDDNAYATKAF